MTRATLKEQLEVLDQDVDAEEASLWGGVRGTFAQQTELLSSPKFREVVQLLQDNPILVSPCLKWLYEKRSAIAKAQLEAIYTPAELEALYAEARAG